MVAWEKLDPDNPPNYGEMGMIVAYKDGRIEIWFPHSYSVKEIIKIKQGLGQELPTYYSLIRYPSIFE